MSRYEPPPSAGELLAVLQCRAGYRPPSPHDEPARQVCEKRRQTALQTCHRYKPAKPVYRNTDRTGAYLPEMSAALWNDKEISDGARRCAAKLVELVYRRNRKHRNIGITVGYLAKALCRSTRTVQYYLAALRARGYIRHEVVISDQARMCAGLFITLLKPLFPRHHREKWPALKENSGAQKNSDKYSSFNKYIYFKDRVGAEIWALKCMDGVFQSYMKTSPLYEN